MVTNRENVVPGNVSIISTLNEVWQLKKNSYGHFLPALKVFKTQRELHHCFTALKIFSYWKKDSVAFLRLIKFLILKKDTIAVLRFFIPKKGSITCLRLLKVLILKNDSVTFLKLVKFIKIAILQNAGEQPLVKVAYHIIFMINELHLLWVTNFIAIGIYFLFGTKFSWNVETDTCFNVECMLLGRNYDFLGGCLVPTGRYLSVTTG